MRKQYRTPLDEDPPVVRALNEGLEGIVDVVTENREHNDTRHARTENRIKRVEADLDSYTSRGRIRASGSNLVHVVPAHLKPQLDLGEAMGKPNPAKDLIFGAYFQNARFAKLATQQRLAHSPEWYHNENDQLMSRAYGVVSKADLGEDTAVLGGNIIATPVAAELMRLIQDHGVCRPLVTKMALHSKTTQIPTETNGVTAYIVAEAGLIGTATNATTFGQEPLTAKKFASLATVSNELMEDNIIMLSDYLFTAIAEKIARLEDSEAIDGNGSNFTGLVAVAGRTTLATSGNTSGGDAPTFDDLVKLCYSATQSATRQNAWFIMHPVAMRHIAGLVDTNGQPIFQYANVPGAVQMSILGYPVGLSSAIATDNVLKTSSTNIYFGPPSKIIFGDVGHMALDIDPFGLFSTAQTRVRVIKRTGITIPVGEYFSVLEGVKNVV